MSPLGSRRSVTLSPGLVFGNLTVEAEAEPVFSGGSFRSRMVCLCDCGSRTVVLTQSLRSGATRSCGCGMRATRWPTTHNMARTAEYRAWRNTRARCQDEKHRCYKDYGGRGITVAGEWLSDFPAFFAHVGPRPTPNHSLDRIDNDGHYEPGNVRWATRSEQQQNRRDSKRRAA